MKSSDTVRKLVGPIFTVTLKSWIQILLIFNIFPVTVAVHGIALVIRCHLGITIHTTGLLWQHWDKDQRRWQREALHTGRGSFQGVLRERGTPENLLLWRFDFTLSNFNVWPYPLCQRRKVWGRGGIWSQGRVVFWHFECSLAKQSEGASQRLEQPVVGNHC